MKKIQYIAKGYTEEVVEEKAEDYRLMYPNRKFGTKRDESDDRVRANDGTTGNLWWLVEIIEERDEESM